MRTSWTMPLAVRPCPLPVSNAGSWMDSGIEQVWQSIREARNRVDCLVIETGHPDQTLPMRTLLEALYQSAQRKSEAIAWLHFSSKHVGPQQSTSPELISIIRDIECAWPSICAELLVTLLTVRIVFLFDMENALQQAPDRYGNFISWCAKNLTLVVLVVSHADCLRGLDFAPLRLIVDRILLPDQTDIGHSERLTSAWIEQASKREQP